MKIFDFNKLTETVSAYIETRIELLKLDIKEEMSKAIAKSMTWGVILICGLTALLFLSLGLALLFNELLNSGYYGYWIVAGIYLIVAAVIYISRDSLERKFSKEVKEAHYSDESLEENEQ
ncbi:MAG TPA: phage holin family protein [Roseivirga sp.]